MAHAAWGYLKEGVRVLGQCLPVRGKEACLLSVSEYTIMKTSVLPRQFSATEPFQHNFSKQIVCISGSAGSE